MVLKPGYVIFVMVMVLSLTHSPVLAQADPPIWQQNLVCDSEKQRYRGLEYCTSRDGQIHVVVMDLLEAGLRFEYVIAEGRDRDGNFGPCQDVNLPGCCSIPVCHDPNNTEVYPVLSLFQAVERYPTAAVILNSDYGATTLNDRGHGPEGFTVIQGNRIDGTRNNDIDDNAVNRPWLAIGHDPLRVTFGQLDQDDGTAPAWIDTGVGGAPWLIRDGSISTSDINDCRNANRNSCTSAVAQTAAGMSGDNRWMFFVVAIGRNAMQTAEFMHSQLSTWEAIKFDGGGSSQLYYGGLPGSDVNERVIYRGDGRWLSQFLAIYAEPGTGIDLDENLPPPLIDPGLQPNWWANLVESISDTWQDFWRGIVERIDQGFNEAERVLEERINQWWQETQERIIETIEQQLLDWLNTMCCIGILPGVVVVWVKIRKDVIRKSV